MNGGLSVCWLGLRNTCLNELRAFFGTRQKLSRQKLCQKLSRQKLLVNGNEPQGSMPDVDVGFRPLSGFDVARCLDVYVT